MVPEASWPPWLSPSTLVLAAPPCSSLGLLLSSEEISPEQRLCVRPQADPGDPAESALTSLNAPYRPAHRPCPRLWVSSVSLPQRGGRQRPSKRDPHSLHLGLWSALWRAAREGGQDPSPREGDT